MNRKLPKKGARLSANEREVLDLLGKGKTTAEIARLKRIRFKTVHTYYARLKSKLGVGTIGQLVRIAALSTTSGISNSLAIVLDRTERIEMRFFDHRGKLIGQRKYRAESSIEPK
jgi:DNA-binding CsgD family transcriptional regulator